MALSLRPRTDALLVIDVQRDFCPGGALAVNEGEAIVPGIVALAERFQTVVLTQDHHPAGHASFASSHGQAPFSSVEFPYGPQTLWPDHCVQGTPGAEFHEDLHGAGTVARAAAIVRKGMNPEVDSYSAFFENDQATATGLAGLLRDRGIERVFCVGLAYDFCVAYSALDARKVGLEAVILKDLTRAIGMPTEGQETTIDVAERAFADAGVVVADSHDLSAKPKTGAFAR